MSEALELLIKYRFDRSERTKKIYREHVTRFIDFVGDIAPSEVNTGQVVDFFIQLKKVDGSEYSKSFQNQVWRTLHLFFEFCRDQEMTYKNPIRGCPKPKVPIGPKPKLSLREVRRLLEVIEETETKRFDCVARNRAMVLLMLDCGLRRGEVIELRFSCLNLDEGEILVWSNKTQTSRLVPVGQETTEAILAYLEQRGPGLADEKIFLTVYGTPVKEHTIDLLFGRIKKRFDDKLHPHLLRHTFARHYINKGELRKLQKILGHSDVRTTATYYAEPDIEAIKAEFKIASPMAQLVLALK
ncbi:MAG: tyrosine-type recombinase/integrase [Anaerolineae bacterium]|nr:tyrosine-type recombinase/integrase [Anaerolineae bacterium]